MSSFSSRVITRFSTIPTITIVSNAEIGAPYAIGHAISARYIPA